MQRVCLSVVWFKYTDLVSLFIQPPHAVQAPTVSSSLLLNTCTEAHLRMYRVHYTTHTRAARDPRLHLVVAGHPSIRLVAQLEYPRLTRWRVLSDILE